MYGQRRWQRRRSAWRGHSRRQCTVRRWRLRTPSGMRLGGRRHWRRLRRCVACASGRDAGAPRGRLRARAGATPALPANTCVLMPARRPRSQGRPALPRPRSRRAPRSTPTVGTSAGTAPAGERLRRDSGCNCRGWGQNQQRLLQCRAHPLPLRAHRAPGLPRLWR